MLWWMVGAGTAMGTMSAWSFTGVAGKIYSSGGLVYMMYVGDVIGYGLVMCAFAAWFRRMRVITVIEAIRLRFGSGAEQFFLWMPLPATLLIAGIKLYAISLFTGVLFGFPVGLTIIVIGVLMIFLVVIGGAWAVMASEFLQLLLLLSVALVTTFFVLRDPAVGGIAGLLQKAPHFAFHWTDLSRASILVPWILLVMINESTQAINISTGAGSFLMVRDEREGRRAAAIPIITFLLFPLVWGIPPLAATFLYRQMPSYAAGLSHPQDAAYLVMAKRVLPDGVLGLLVAGLFSATLSSLNTGLNRSAGIVVRSFYLSLIRPSATEVQQVRVGRCVTVGFGAFIVGIAVALVHAHSLPLFELGLLFSTWIALPIAIPLILVFFFRRTPAWASWSSSILGIAFAIAMKLFFTPEFVNSIWHGAALSPRESEDLYIFVQIGGTVVISSGWFILSQLWPDRESSVRRSGREEFYSRLARPIKTPPEVLRDAAFKQYTYLGWLCVVWMLAISGLSLMPNSSGGHVALLLMAFLYGSVAAVLLRLSRGARLCEVTLN